MLTSLSSLTILLLLTCGVSINSNGYYLQQLDRAAYSGDVSKVVKLVELRLNWNQLYKDQKSVLTAVHHALRGRHDTLATQSLQLIGNHEAVIDHLINKAFLNPSLGCPLYYAVHYRNVRALELLLKSSSKYDVLECLTTQDVNGDTALHSAASSKASGFARFYTKLLTNSSQMLQQFTEEVLQLLDLRYSKSFQLEYLSFEDLTMAIGHTDITMILQHLKEDLDCNNILNKYHNTILHIAAASGRLQLVRMLIASGCSVTQQNIYKQTPIELATNAGHQQIAFELMQSQFDLQTDVLFKETDVCKNYHTDIFWDVVNTGYCKLSDFGVSQYLTSGWHSNYHSGKLKCNIECIYDAVNMEKFQQYYSRKQPVVFKNILEWPAWNHWRKNEFIRRYGNISVQLSSIPYAELYGYHQEHLTESIMLSQFIENFDNLSSYRYPPYLFDAHILQHYSELASDVPVTRMLSNFSISLSQLILGPKGSGSPPHFHRDTVNGLVYGIKQWYLWPPAEAFFSILHIQDWINQYGYYGNYSDAVECIQLPGDILYIPDNWGHAVVNEAHSIGFAYEFH